MSSQFIDKTAIKGFYVANGMSGHGFMFVPASLAVTLTQGKETLYFCSDECRGKFNQSTKTS